MKITSTILALTASLSTSAASAQTATTARSTASAYGARLTDPGDPTEGLNSRRYNNRINSRINNRLSLRIERYRVGSTDDPSAAYKQQPQTTTSAYDQADGVGQRALNRQQSTQAVPQTRATSIDPYERDANGQIVTTPRR